MAICMAVYGYLWQRSNKRHLAQEQKRVEEMRSRGLLDEKE
jgi:hypothetical protein